MPNDPPCRHDPSSRLLALLLLSAAAATASAQTAAPQFAFTHLAGTAGGPGSGDGIGTVARFNLPRGAAIDAAGNIYVADAYNHTVRKIAPNGMVVTRAGQPGEAGSADGGSPNARFSYPSAVAVDNLGYIYVADWGNDTIRRIDPSGIVTTLAGTPGMLGEVDGTGPAARFAGPCGLVVDAAGNLLVADTYGESIRKVTPAGVVTTLTLTGPTFDLFGGSPIEPIWGSLAGAHLSQLTIDSTGNLYTCDEIFVPSSYGYPSYFLVQKVSPAGDITSVATPAGLSGVTSAVGTPLRLPTLIGTAVDAADNLLIATSTGIIKIDPSGAGSLAPTASPIAGTGAILDHSGNLVITDTYGNQVIRVAPDGTVSHLAGLAAEAGSADGSGTSARFASPSGVAAGGDGTVYVADTYNSTVRKIASDGTVTTLAGTPARYADDIDGAGAAAAFSRPQCVAVDAANNVFVGEGSGAVRKITPAGAVTTLPGVLTNGNGLAVDRAGNLYVASWSLITKVTPAGVVTTLAGNNQNPGGAEGGPIDGTGAAAQFGYIQGLAVDPSGNVIATDQNTIRRITPAGVVTTISSAFRNPTGVAVDAAGNIFTTDSDTVRMLSPSGGVTTLAGVIGLGGSADGLGLDAMFNSPAGIAVDANDNLYVADTGNNSIRKGQIAGPPVITSQPQSETVMPGDTAQFSVRATGTGPLYYQWYFNGSALSGATGTSLAVGNTSAANAGDYTVIVVNALGSAGSNKATLAVSATPAGPSGTPASGGGGGALGAGFVFALAAFAAARGMFIRAGTAAKNGRS